MFERFRTAVAAWLSPPTTERLPIADGGTETVGTDGPTPAPDSAPADGAAESLFGLELVLDSIDLPTFVLDDEGVVRLWDSGTEAVLGIDRATVIDEPNPGAVLYDDASRQTLAEKVLEAPQDADSAFSGVGLADPDYAVLNSSGAPVYEDTSTDSGNDIWFIATPLYRDGDLVGVIEVVQDRTDSARYQDEVAALFEELAGTVDAYQRGEFDARAAFDRETSILDDDLLDIVDAVNGLGAEMDETVSRLHEERDQQARVAAEVTEAVAELQATAAAVADSSERVSGLTGDQVETMSDVADEIANLSATVEEIAASADQVEATSEAAADLAVEGRSTASQTLTVMSDVDEATDEVTEDIDRLQARVAEIDDIVDVINGIAEQTNILALNASIEAARAGEAGSGFAVVADEVKSLAEESQEQAGRIEETVERIQAETETTVESLESTTDRVADGIEQVEAVTESLDDIVDAATETADGIREVSSATDDQASSTAAVASMVDEAVDTAEETAESIEDIAAKNRRQTERIDEIQAAAGDLADDR